MNTDRRSPVLSGRPFLSWLIVFLLLVGGLVSLLIAFNIQRDISLNSSTIIHNQEEILRRQAETLSILSPRQPPPASATGEGER